MSDSRPGERCLAGARLGTATPGVATSFRLHRARGPFCGRGYCQQCSVVLADGQTALACQIPKGVATFAGIDLLKPVGLVAERLPPWFYESRFLKPRALRQAYLSAIRFGSAAHPLPAQSTVRPTTALRRESCYTLVVGGGLAGLEASAELAAAGRDVLVLEASTLGGSARCFPSLRERIDRLIARARELRIRILEGTSAAGFFREEGVMAAYDQRGPIEVEFVEMVVAVGAYDRPLTYRGNDLPGTIGARAFETYAAQGVFAGVEVGVFAAPEEAGRVARAADEHGVRLAWTAGPADATIVEAGGAGRVRWVELDNAGRKECDVLVIGFSQPTYELQIQAGMTVTLEGEPAVIRPAGATHVPVLVVGEAAGHLDPATAGDHGRDAARAWTQGQPDPPAPEARRLGRASVAHPEAFVCLCEDVRLSHVETAIAQGFADVELLKRRTGAGTGACQGKLCIAQLAGILALRGLPARLPTNRPPLRPIPLAALAAE